jgi:16S rRNA (uracil1498-N3)-methyltransferase
MELFFCKNILTIPFELGSEESHHLLRVHRKRIGDEVHLFDGFGTKARANVHSIQKDHVWVNVFEIENFQPNSKQITLAVSPLKSEDRWEWLLEKATEIGISAFLPILCERTESKRFRMDRYEKIVLGAAKQSLKAFIPIIHPPIPLKQAVEKINQPFYFGHCLDSFPKTEFKSVSISFPATIAIGPEGDFSPSEISFMSQANGIPISLGMERLRTETAAIVASTIGYL